MIYRNYAALIRFCINFLWSYKNTWLFFLQLTEKSVSTDKSVMVEPSTCSTGIQTYRQLDTLPCSRQFGDKKTCWKRRADEPKLSLSCGHKYSMDQLLYYAEFFFF